MLQHTKELGRQLQRSEQSKVVTTNVKGLTISDTKRRQQNHTERDQVNFRCNSSAVKKLTNLRTFSGQFAADANNFFHCMNIFK